MNIRDNVPVRSEDLSGKLEGEPEESQPTESKDYADARADFWTILGDFIYRHHNEPRVQLHVPKEENFTISLKYIDVTRSTFSDLDVMQENRVDDYWNVDSSRSFSDSWRCFTKFALLEEKPKGYMWSVIKMIIKGRSPTMRDVSRPTELRLIGCLTESIWKPKSKSNMLTPKTNLLTC